MLFLLIKSLNYSQRGVNTADIERLCDGFNRGIVTGIVKLNFEKK